nr:reverse transcriptase domain-containing protein [Tanacetum cinerariifolium]
MAPTRRSNPNNNDVKPNITEIIAQQLQTSSLRLLLPHLVTPKSKRIERYIHGLAPQIRGMIRETQPVTIQSAILKAPALTDEVVMYGTLSKSSKKIKEFVESSKQGETDHFLRDCQSPVKQVAPVNAVRMGNNQRVCYECGSPDYFHNICPKLNRAPGQVGNCLTIKGSQNSKSNGNQTRGRAFNVNAVKAHQDPNIVTEDGCNASLL